jgi:hypothetical protein
LEIMAQDLLVQLVDVFQGVMVAVVVMVDQE